MHFAFCTLFPEFFQTPMQQSIVKRAIDNHIISWNSINIRDFSLSKHKNVDDTPYGGMPGMLMQASPIADAIEYAKQKNPNAEVIYFSPVGTAFTQKKAIEKANNKKDKILICGHYEGIDQRVIDSHVDEIISVGNAVLSGGEIAALYFCDAITRLLPNAIGDMASHEQESFSDDFFRKGEYPQYTKPEVWNDIRVPQVLLSGNHKKIEEWKMQNLQGLSEIEKISLYLKKNIFSPEKPKKYRYFSLRNPILEDATDWVDAFSDPEVTKNILVDQITYEQEISFLQEENINLLHLTLSALHPKTKEVMANSSLYFSNEIPHVATFGIVVKKKFWEQGIGTNLTKTMCDIGFTHFPMLQKIRLWVFPKNIVAQHIYEKIGFEKIGVQKKEHWKNNEYHDVLLYEKMKP